MRNRLQELVQILVATHYIPMDDIIQVFILQVSLDLRHI